MVRKNWKLWRGLFAAAMVVGAFTPLIVCAQEKNGWEVVDGNYYWYENGVKQGTEGRGKEIYDPDSNAWYWLDAVDGGKKAVSKDLYQESDAGDWAENKETRTGKWVRYDEDGHMVKGWYTNENGTYYFDLTYGTMAKGNVTIEGKSYHFDETTGILQAGAEVVNGWQVIDGNYYWYENGVKQGTEGRGKEIFDPGSNAWYWLDAVDGGKKAVSKDLYQESEAGEWAENKETKTGKWVRYDENGHMIKGWYTNEKGTYYFDMTYGTMAKGTVTIDGKQYEFETVTGILKGEKKTEGTENSEDSKEPSKDTESENTNNSGIEEIDEDEIKYEGQDGEVTWKITINNKLIITGTCGKEQENGWYEAGWRKYREEIESAYVDVSNATSLRGLFDGTDTWGAYLLKDVDLSNLDTSKVTDMSYMFKNCAGLKSLNLSNLDTGNVTDMSYMFSFCSRLSSLDLSSLDTGNVTDMSYMFCDCSNLSSLNLDSVDTGNVKNMSWMFDRCTALQSLDLSSFDTRNVTAMTYMFNNCKGLTNLDLSNFDTRNVTDMSAMFIFCEGLTSLNVSSFNTSSVTNMNYMFNGCAALTSLDLSSFDTSSVIYMSSVFAGCKSLTSLDLSSFSTKSVERMFDVFNGCSSLQEILVGENWGTACSFGTFTGCGTDHVTLKQ